MLINGDLYTCYILKVNGIIYSMCLFIYLYLLHGFYKWKKMKYIEINNCFGGIIYLNGYWDYSSHVQIFRMRLGWFYQKFITLIPLRDVMADQWGHHVL